MKFLQGLKVCVNETHVLRLLGQRNGKAPVRTVKRLNQFISRARALVEPRVVYCTRKIQGVERGAVTLEGGISFKSVKLSKSLSKCDRATVFLATIGNDIDELITGLSKENKLSDASIYDAIGSVAVEEAVDYFQNSVDHDVSETRNCTTMRFSPGYCDWSVREQKKIFDVLDSEAAGVSLSSSFLMNPRKSVSGVFGIGLARRETRPNPCTLCANKSCRVRR